MKNTKTAKWLSLLAITAFVAIIAISMTACKDDDSVPLGFDGGGGTGGWGTGGTGGGGGGGTWKAVTNSPFGTDDTIRAIAYGNGKFVAAGGYEKTHKIATSSDGVNWTAVKYDLSEGIGRSITAIAYGNGKFVAGWESGGITYSTDGVNWIVVDTDAFDFPPYKGRFQAIVFGNGTFVASAENGNFSSNRIATSTNGTDWIPVTTNAFDGKIIIYGEQYQFEHAIETIAYGNGRFVAGTNDGIIATSTDGKTWTAVADSKISIESIAYGGGKFVAVGDGGGIAYSNADGTSWTVVKNDKIGGAGLFAVAYGNGRFVVGGGDKWDYTMGYSTDGQTWTELKQSIFRTGSAENGDDARAIVYGGGKFVAVGQHGKIAYSSD